MPDKTSFDRLITAALCALAITAAAGCSGKAETKQKHEADKPDRPLPSAIRKADKTMTTTTPDHKAEPSVEPTPTTTPAAAADHKVVTPDVAELLASGRRLVKQRAYGEAVDKLRQVLSAKPEHARAHIELARAYIKLGKARTARPHAEKAVKLRPKLSYAWNTLGRVELLENKFDAAEASFKRAIKANEHNLYAYNNLGLTYLKAKRFEDAAKALQKATEDKRARAYMWNNLGAAHEQLGNTDKAREAYKKAAAKGSGSAKRSLARLNKTSDSDDTDEASEADIE